MFTKLNESYKSIRGKYNTIKEVPLLLGRKLDKYNAVCSNSYDMSYNIKRINFNVLNQKRELFFCV